MQSRTPISCLLVANRGEIAVRVMRTCKSLGIRTVAVYSEADAAALHVRMADDAVPVGPAPVGESYLVVENILRAAQDSGAQAIHPGYGLLSENAGFARACAAAGLIFVGPPPGAIEIMADKALAKRAMIAAGVPCVPGYQGEEQSAERMIAEARELGFPLLVKAAAGGGGRGMRLVQRAEELASAFALARSEAENAFGSGALILERAISQARHVEIQVFADQHGQVLHLGERDCSVQRRHQKVVEESPGPRLNPELRERMGDAAVAAARAVDYVGAGTVEFLLDASGEFYFLEMNTRLQVEHPVTELVTGLDLVALQLAVAQGEALKLQQADIVLRGHAMEVRLYAEDAQMDFLPAAGPVLHWQAPEGDGIRVDSGVVSGVEIAPFYDPLVAKIIAHGANREQARQRLVAALRDTALFGVATNRDFLLDVLQQPNFVAGCATTAFIEETWPGGYQGSAQPPLDYAVAAVLQYLLGREQACSEAVDVNRELLDWSSAGDLQSVYRYNMDGELQTLRVQPQAASRYRVGLGSERVDISLQSMAAGRARLEVNQRGVSVLYHAQDEQTLHLAFTGSGTLQVTNLVATAAATAEQDAGGLVAAPMHGVLLSLPVAEGDSVSAGDTVAILEAMKMQQAIAAPIAGRVVRIRAAAGDQLGAAEPILEIEPAA